MSYVKIIRIVSKLIHLALLFIAFSCGDQRRQEAYQPKVSDYKVGEKWTWEWKSSVNGEVRGQGKDVQEVVNFKNELGFYFDNTKQDTVKATKVLNRKKSKTPFRDWPLEVGKKWTYENEWVNESGEKGKTSQRAEVISFEEVDVPAGKFKAYKIEYNGFIENYEAGGKGKVTDTFWYCPELKVNIKHIQKGANDFMYSSELVEYTMNK